MEKIIPDFSEKDIPLPTTKDFQMTMIRASEDLIRRLRWKVAFATGRVTVNSVTEKYGFRSPKPIKELKEFEDGLLEIVKQCDTNSKVTPFLAKLRAESNRIKSDGKMFVSADKTVNIYKVGTEVYQNLVNKEVNADYKKASVNSVKKVEEAEKKLVSDLGLSDRVFQSKKKKAYITLKDHKDNFANNPKARLINPAKTEVGKISKIKLDSMIREIRTKTLLKSWRATNDTLCWFNALPNRQLQTFLEFDIVSFYPTISELLLTKAVDWGSKFVNVSQMDKAIIMQARQSMLFLNMEPWSKKSGEFDVTMGAWDGAEICVDWPLYA